MLRQGVAALRTIAVPRHGPVRVSEASRNLYRSAVTAQSSSTSSAGSSQPIDITESHAREVPVHPSTHAPVQRPQGSMARRRAKQSEYDNGRGPKDAQRQARGEGADFWGGGVDLSQSRRKGLASGAVEMRLQDLEQPFSVGGTGKPRGPRDGARGKGPQGARGPRIQGGPGDGDRRARGKPGQKAKGKQRNTAVARRRRSHDEDSVPRVTAERLPEKHDQSPKAIFGASSLVKPPRKGARDPEKSVWAKEMEPSHARLQEILRLAGSYDLMIPKSPSPATLPPKTPPMEKAKAIASWTMAQNPTMGMRKTASGADVFSAFLK